MRSRRSEQKILDLFKESGSVSEGVMLNYKIKQVQTFIRYSKVHWEKSTFKFRCQRF